MNAAPVDDADADADADAESAVVEPVAGARFCSSGAAAGGAAVVAAEGSRASVTDARWW